MGRKALFRLLLKLSGGPLWDFSDSLRREILRTSQARSSRKLGRAHNLGFHPRNPLCSRLRCLKRLGEVPSVSPHLPVAQLEDCHHVEYLPAAVVRDTSANVLAK
jgi:hypothetical protein